MQRLRPKWLAKRPAPRQPTNWPRLQMLAEKRKFIFVKYYNVEILREIKFSNFEVSKNAVLTVSGALKLQF